MSGPDRSALLMALWMGAASLAAFAAMGADKRRARLGLRRIPEARLFLWALLGGGAGAWLGLRLFRHKTRHRAFALGFPALALLQLAALAVLILR